MIFRLSPVKRQFTVSAAVTRLVGDSHPVISGIGGDVPVKTA